MGKVCNVAAPINAVNGIIINRSKPCKSSNYTNMPSRTVEYLVFHYTGNDKDSAANNASYFSNATVEASAHYFVDDISIWQSVDANDKAWHCGTSGTYYHSSCRNTNSIGIEMCCTAGNYKIGDKALENAVQLGAALCRYFDITDVDEYVVRHYDVTHKWCPAQMAGDNNAEWIAFKDRIKAILNIATTTVKEYKLITTVNRYLTATDAKAQTNSCGTYEAGTYYIYNKYPDGVNGVYNISTEKTGATAGSWINPIENIIKETVATTDKLYRVRKTKDDANTQKGAYINLDGAIECCQAAGEGYHVFNWDYNIVYSYKAPVDTEEPVDSITVEVYDLDYPEKVKIVELDKEQEETALKIGCTKAIKNILGNNADFDVEIAKVFFSLAPKYGIDPMMAISQSVLETGWFKYNGSAVIADQHNYCGMGVTSNGISGNSFDSIYDGVRAQLQHLYAYGCKDELPEGETIIDPRFKYVTRGIAPFWQNLAGRWAVPGFDGSSAMASMEAGTTYGQKITRICNDLNSTAITETDIQLYFPERSPTDEQPSEIKEHDSILQKIIKIIKWLLSLLKK